MCRSCFNRASLLQIVLNCSKCRTWQLTNDEGNPCTETVHGFGRKGLKTQSCVNQSSANQVESNHFFMTQVIRKLIRRSFYDFSFNRFHSWHLHQLHAPHSHQDAAFTQPCQLSNMKTQIASIAGGWVEKNI